MQEDMKEWVDKMHAIDWRNFAECLQRNQDSEDSGMAVSYRKKGDTEHQIYLNGRQLNLAVTFQESLVCRGLNIKVELADKGD